MIVFRWLSIVTLVAVPAFSGVVTYGAGQQKAAIPYENLERSFRETIILEENGVGLWQGGKILPEKRLRSQERGMMFGEITSYPARDCSNEKYRCVLSFHRVYAVPRARLLPTDTYSVAGAVLKVEECLRGDANVCQVALISSDCQQITGKDSCLRLPGGRKAGVNAGPFIYFIYNEDFGVTAYGEADGPVQDPVKRRGEVAYMILRAKRGLLAARGG